MSYIEKEPLLEKVKSIEEEYSKGGGNLPSGAILECRLEILASPSVDVVEVVRCKDCKHLYCLDAIDRRFYCRHSPKGLTGINIVEDNPYCSYGERREE